MIAGGAGRDKMSGGFGDDTFQYKLGDGRDIIQDFNIGSNQLLLDKDFFEETDHIELQSYRFKDFLVERQLLVNTAEGALLKMSKGDQLRLNGLSVYELQNHHFGVIDG